jgi:segregation and condensation protein B
MARRPASETVQPLDTELADLPPELRWREWMGRIEAAIFASAEPVPREVLAKLVGQTCVLDDLIADIRDELKARPYELVAIAGGWQHRTRPRFIEAIRAASKLPDRSAPDLSKAELEVLALIAYRQPISRERLSDIAGRAISRDTLAWLKQQDLITTGPRLAQPGAPATYVTTGRFLEVFGLASLDELPEMKIEQAQPVLSNAHRFTS